MTSVYATIANDGVCPAAARPRDQAVDGEVDELPSDTRRATTRAPPTC
jgi:hypothetical protein